MRVSVVYSKAEQYEMLHKLQVFRLHGRDKCGHTILSILGKFFLGGLISEEVVRKYLEEVIYPKLKATEGGFSVVYIHTGVEYPINIPAIRSLLGQHVPVSIKEMLHRVYFLHPGLQSRLFLATFGRLFYSGLYGKVKYVSRVEYLWEDIRRKEIELPQYVHQHDLHLEYQLRPPMMDYGIESDHPRPTFDSSVPIFSMRCIS